MTTLRDHTIAPGDRAGAAPTSGPLPQLTPELAQHMAMLLAPYLRSMRAVLADTPYAADEYADSGEAPRISPATRIFIAGVLGSEPGPTERPDHPGRG